MIFLPEEVLQLMDEGRLNIRGLMRFDFGNGSYGFWTGSRPFTYAGLEYLPGGVIKVDDVNASVGYEAATLTISLAEAPEDGLTPEALGRIEEADYHQRPVRLWDAYFHPDTDELLHMMPVYQGLIDTIRHNIDSEEAGIVATCHSRAIDNAKTGYRLRSTADQQSMWSGDRFFEHAEIAGKQEIFFGRSKS
jgi:hypothetical protein